MSHTSRLLGLFDAAHEEGLEGRHIEAWLEFEHEALRLGISPEASREDLERWSILAAGGPEGSRELNITGSGPCVPSATGEGRSPRE